MTNTGLAWHLIFTLNRLEPHAGTCLNLAGMHVGRGRDFRAQYVCPTPIFTASEPPQSAFESDYRKSSDT